MFTPTRNEAGWIRTYTDKEALFLHDGNPLRPHPLLSKGGHSNGYFNSELIIEDPFLLDQAAYDLMLSLERSGLHLDEVDRVVGPAMGAITLAHNVALYISRLRKPNCLFAYTAKAIDGLSMSFARLQVKIGERVLVVEDVLTSGGSVEQTVTAIQRAGGIVLPFVGVLVNRSGLIESNGKKIVALINREMPVWQANECPLCKQGSEAIHPKDAGNWARLNTKYPSA